MVATVLYIVLERNRLCSIPNAFCYKTAKMNSALEVLNENELLNGYALLLYVVSLFYYYRNRKYSKKTIFYTTFD